MSKEPQSMADLFACEEFSPITQKIESKPDDTLARSVASVIKKAPSPLAKPELKPETVKDSMSIIQPKAITYASYDLTAVQEDMLTYITDQLQDYASSKASMIRPDLFGQLSVELDTNDFPALGRNKKKMILEVDKLRKADFVFSWNAPFKSSSDARSMFGEDSDEVSYEIETKGNIITTRHDIKGTSRVILDINPWVVPFLLYYGKGVGGTKYFKDIALTLPSKYSKRIYKMIMDWHTMGDHHEEPISDFRSSLQIPESYDNNKIKKEILERAREEIRKSNSHITFDYELITRDYSESRTKKKADTIVFSIHGNHIKKDSQLTDVKTMNMCLVEIADKGRGPICKSCAEYIVENGKFKHIMSKFKYYNGLMHKHEISQAEYTSTLLKIVLEETNFELRTPEHVKNSERYMRKNRRK